ncbi:hypothetical protein [Ramlibacter sp. PS4R-6]
MGALAITRWVTVAVRWIPAPLHRALDAWSRQLATRRRLKRLARQPR